MWPEEPGEPDPAHCGAEPGDQDAVRPAPGPDPEEVVPHADTGLDLARAVARGLARPGGRRRNAGSSPGSSPGSSEQDPRGAPRFNRRPSRRVDPTASGAHPDERDPQTLDATIGRLIDDQGWRTDVRVHGVFSRWEHLVGPEVAQHCRPETFAQTRLGVRTDSTAWATQLRLLAPALLRRLNAELGPDTVTVIDVRGPDAPSWKHGLRSVRDGRGPRDTYG